MSYASNRRPPPPQRPTRPVQRQERNGPEDRMLQQALEMHAKMSFGVIQTIASERNVGWQDAAEEYLKVFERVSVAELARIAEAVANRKMGGGR